MSEVVFPEPKEDNDVSFDSDEIEIVEVDDRPEEDRRPVREDVEPFNIDEEIDIQDERVKKRLNRLKYEYHQQRREKEAAQRLRDEAVQFAQNTQNNYKTQMQNNTTQQQADSNVPVEQPPQQEQLDPRLQDWLARNSWFGAPGNEALTGFTYGLDEMLIKRGVARNSPEYFSAVDQALRESFPRAFGVEQQQAERQQTKSSTVVAPAQRGTKRKTQVELTRSEIELTRKLKITPEQYALQKRRMGL